MSQLYDLLLEIRDQYSEILMKKWVAVFNSIFDEDNYSPIMASDEKEYKETIDVYPFKDPQLEQVKWNQKLIHKNFQVLQSYAFVMINKKPTCNAQTEHKKYRSSVFSRSHIQEHFLSQTWCLKSTAKWNNISMHVWSFLKTYI